MRQAGRYMPQYRKLRQRHSILDLCHDPELAAAVTLQPVERLGVDAAIVFADILLPFEPLRLGLSFTAGEGPHIDRPIRDAADVERLPSFNVDAELGFVMEGIRLARRALPGDVPLIGFAGAPFTLASYAIEGGGSRTFTKTKRFMYQTPDTWHLLLSKFADLIGGVFPAQTPAGAPAAELVRSWVGGLLPGGYRPHFQPPRPKARALASTAHVPLRHLGAPTPPLLSEIPAA